MYRLDWLYRVFDGDLDRDFIVWREQKYSYSWLQEHLTEWKAIILPKLLPFCWR